MLINISYNSRDKRDQINELVQKPFGLVERFKLRGIGSQKFVVKSCDKRVRDLFSYQSGVIYTNIELRPAGIIVWFRARLDNWVVVLPYFSLVVYSTGEELSLFSGTWKFKLKPAHNRKLDRKFVAKILQLKSDFTDGYSDISEL